MPRPPTSPLPVLALAALAWVGWRAMQRTRAAHRAAGMPAGARPEDDDGLAPLGMDPSLRQARPASLADLPA